MNSVQLIGRLTRDPELRPTAEEGELCRMRVAVSRPEAGAQPVYVDVVCFDGQAAACADHLTKGHRIGVEGRLDYSEWEAEDGSKRSRHEVIGRRIEFIGAPGKTVRSGAPLDSSPAEARPDEDESPAKARIPF